MAKREKTPPMRGPGSGPIGFEKPKDIKGTSVRILGYLGNSKLLLAVAIVTLLVNSVSMLAGSYFLKPLINNYILPGDFRGLAMALLLLGTIHLAGTIASYLQSRTMVTIAQRTTNIMRRDLFNKMQELELKYFDKHTHGELMSRYTNDVENVQLMLEQSLTQLIFSVITFVGSIVLMIVLSPILF